MKLNIYLMCYNFHYEVKKDLFFKKNLVDRRTNIMRYFPH